VNRYIQSSLSRRFERSLIAMVCAICVLAGLFFHVHSAHAQAANGCNPGDTIDTFPCSTVMAFDNAYWNAQPAPVRALKALPGAACKMNGDGVPGDRCNLAFTLAKQGYTIDVPIMQWGWDAYTVMTLRGTYGYTWVPSALGAPVYLPPGLSFPNLAPYNAANAPPGSIKVDNVAGDYAPSSDCSTAPVCSGTAAPATQPATNTVGPDLMTQANVTFGTPQQTVTAEVHSSTSTQHFAEGTIYTDSTNARYAYHLLGTEMMSAGQRIGIWVGPLPAAAAAPFTIALQ